MLNLHFKSRVILFVAVSQLIAFATMAQVKYSAFSNVNSTIHGTSTLHNWSMKTATGECKATFTLNTKEELTGLTALSLSIPAASLKSKNKGMDKNAYKALKITENESITFNLTSATMNADGTIKCNGKLSIAGKELDATLNAVTKINPDKSIGVSGSKKISMKEFDMVPPTFMAGMVKTGNDITLNFDLVLKKI